MTARKGRPYLRPAATLDIKAHSRIHNNPTGGIMLHELVRLRWTPVNLGTIHALALSVCAPTAAAELTLDGAVGNPARSAKFVVRDKARHPFEELTFFGVTPQSTVVEIWPGGG
jgi:hypothetical protein